jgi:PAS domain S-box-containing protein
VSEPIQLLIVEDVDTDLALVESELTRGGITYAARHAANRTEFFARIDESLPDLVLTDFNLPDIDGMDVVRELARRSTLVPVIIVTGSLDEVTAVECIKGGATDYVLKEHLSRLVPSVRAAMELRRLRSEELRAHREIARARDYYITLLDEFPNPVWRTGPDARCDYVNKAWLAFSGGTLDDMIGEGWVDAIHPDDLPATAATWFSAFESRTPIFAEFRLRRHDGQYHWFASHGRPIVDLDGIFAGYIGSLSDVQAHHELQTRIESQWRFLESVLDHIDQIVYVFDADDVFQYANLTAINNRNLPLEELIGQSLFSFKTPTKEYLAAYSHARETREKVHRESLELPTRAGDRRIYDAWFIPFVGPDGSNGMISSFSDVTNRVDLERTRLLLMTAIEHASEAVVITDSKGRIEYVNPAFEATTGYSAEEALGQNPNILKSGQHADTFYEELWSTIASGRAWRGLLVNRRKDGSLFREEASISPVPDADGRLTHFVAVKRDLSREVELEQRLAHSQKLDAVGRLAGGIAHDFNNLLAVIGGYAELLTHSLASDHPGQLRIEQMRKATDRATALTRQLLAFGRKQVFQPTVVDLNRLLEESRELLKQLLREPVELEIVRSKEPANVLVDRSQMEQVIFNLAANSRQAMPSGGRFSVAIARIDVDIDSSSIRDAIEPGQWVRITISDTGVGIPQDKLPQIFEPFFTTRADSGGTGLGLATVYGIVRQSGGNISVRSKAGSGTTFVIYLPATEGPVENAAEPPSATLARRHAGGITVLVAEDVDLLREMIREGLEAAGMSVIEARDGEEALALSRSETRAIDVLLTDVVMPKMSGRALGERMRAEREGLRILFMSGYTGEIIAATGVLEEGLNLLQKPFTIDTLVERIQALLGGPNE